MSGAGGWRRFEVAVNAEALALAWIRQEQAPQGAVVVVDHEISPRGRLGRLWAVPQERTATVAVVWRPELPPDQADLVWTAASLGLLAARDALAGAGARLFWPDLLVGPDGALVGQVRAEVQLGPGRVTSAAVTGRLALDDVPVDRSVAIDALAAALRAAAETLGEPAMCATSYDRAAALTGAPVVVTLLPRGSTRGTVRGVDASGRLELVSATGLVERVPLDGLDRVEVVERREP